MVPTPPNGRGGTLVWKAGGLALSPRQGSSNGEKAESGLPYRVHHHEHQQRAGSLQPLGAVHVSASQFSSPSVLH